MATKMNAAVTVNLTGATKTQIVQFARAVAAMAHLVGCAAETEIDGVDGIITADVMNAAQARLSWYDEDDDEDEAVAS